MLLHPQVTMAPFCFKQLALDQDAANQMAHTPLLSRGIEADKLSLSQLPVSQNHRITQP